MPAFDKPAVNFVPRVTCSLAVLGLGYFMLLVRLWYLQVVRGEYFHNESENNRRAIVYVQPPRGIIQERNGTVLVKNRPSFDIDLFAEEAPDPKRSVSNLAKLLGIDEASLLEKMRTQKRRRRFEPKLLLKDVSRDIVAQVTARSFDLPGVTVSVNPAREYVYGALASHILGYIREISPEQLESSHFAGARPGELVGRYGVEYRWDRYLRGERGEREVIINALLVRIAEAGFQSPKAGRNVALTIDFAVQEAAELALADKRGAIVALNPDTGEVLALASAPVFNPQLFSGAVSEQQWQELESGKEKRLTNRVVQGGYPPGSTFKAIMAVAGLSEKVITPREHIFCPGIYHVGPASFRCHKHEGHGAVDLKDAIKRSCDVYFYTVGQRLGIDLIHKYATMFGLGSATGLELVQEQRGLVPSTAWKREYYKNRGPDWQRWWPGETPSVSIGQGALVVTPLQLARAYSALVNGGKLFKPYVVKSIHASDSPLNDVGSSPEVMQEVGVSQEVLNLVRGGLVAVVNEPGGTGSRAKVSQELGVLVGGKSGTSQIVGERSALRGHDFKDHAWFVGYAPADKPQIVVAALVENGGHGGVAAAPLVSQVLESYFLAQKKGETDVN